MVDNELVDEAVDICKNFEYLTDVPDFEEVCGMS